jgi:hypothetical protein
LFLLLVSFLVILDEGGTLETGFALDWLLLDCFFDVLEEHWRLAGD